MKDDPGLYDRFLANLGLGEPQAERPPPQPVLPSGAHLNMSGWSVAGNVVIIPDAGPDALDKVLRTRAHGAGGSGA